MGWAGDSTFATEQQRISGNVILNFEKTGVMEMAGATVCAYHCFWGAGGIYPTQLGFTANFSAPDGSSACALG
jgi:hypothetical protein